MRSKYLAMKCTRVTMSAGLLLSLALAPAHAGEGLPGLWCGTGPLHEYSLVLAQRSARELSGTVSRKQRSHEVRGWLEGNVLRTESTRVGSLVLELVAGELRITGGNGPISLLKGMIFTRARGAACGG